jgi:hypothetical protein
MKKKTEKKLVLAKETVYQLTEGTLRGIAAGSDTMYPTCGASDDRFCQTLITRGTC